MVAVAFLAWRSVDRAINVPEASVWWVPIIFFSCFFWLAYLSIIAIRRADFLQWLFLAAILSSFFFVREFWHLNAVFAAYVFLSWGVSRITDDLGLNIKISLWKSIRAGNSLLVLAVCLLISSQYYLSVKDFDTERLIPQFRVNPVSGTWTSEILAKINPNLEDISRNDLTVDQFILRTQADQDPESAVSEALISRISRTIEEANPGLTEAQKKLLVDEALRKFASADMAITKERQELILQEGRKQFSELSGNDLKGDEQIADVFSDILNQKINQYFNSGSTRPGAPSALPVVVSVGLLLTVLSVGSALSLVWILAAEAAFWIFRKTGLVHVVKVPVEMEVIE